ncbi:MAG: NAD-dependent epimerase/dehydratase family protein [Micrococcales bacterium]|nr:NAD-dependent epimerase/dehydratase family protein [Micrococcales bacterium]
MRIVIVGGTGNVGSALVRRLRADPDAVPVVLARRLPRDGGQYGGVEAHRIDVAGADAVVTLTRLFRGADAVVDLAWALQPNRHPRRMWETNVRGLGHVLRAVRGAAVPQVVVASSVGAYSLGPKRRRVDESWPTGGTPSSHYGRFKAEVERVLDRFEAAEPGIVVSRVRPGLVLQAAAGAEIRRLFVGRVPLGPVDRLRLPILPLPRRLVAQVVHADDLADALARILSRRASGAFNIAAEPPIGPEEVAGIFGARAVPIPWRLLRGLTALGWRTRLSAADPGWIDLAIDVPLMSTERARRELEWEPRIDARDAVTEVLRAAVRWDGLPESTPLRPGR